MGHRRIHLHLDIEGGIRNAATLKGAITVDGRVLMTVKEIRAFLREQLALGRRVLPMDNCDNFNYQTGCGGHDVMTCRVCGCTDLNACPGGCYWVEDELCSRCAK